jgi:hypothetical protein
VFAAIVKVEPATQGVQVLWTVVVQSTNISVPAAQVAHDAHAALPVVVLKVPAEQELHPVFAAVGEPV